MARPLSIDRLRELLWRVDEADRRGVHVYPVATDDLVSLIEVALEAAGRGPQVVPIPAPESSDAP